MLPNVFVYVNLKQKRRQQATDRKMQEATETGQLTVERIHPFAVQLASWHCKHAGKSLSCMCCGSLEIFWLPARANFIVLVMRSDTQMHTGTHEGGCVCVRCSLPLLCHCLLEPTAACPPLLPLGVAVNSAAACAAAACCCLLAVVLMLMLFMRAQTFLPQATCEYVSTRWECYLVR